MSRPVKDMMIRDFKDRLGDREDAMLINLRGISSNDTNAIRGTLRAKNIHVTVVRNNLARKAFEGTGLAALEPLLDGPNTMAYGAESVVEVAREIVDLVKKFPDIELRGAVLDGQLFEGEAGVKELSKFPTRDEAIAQVVTLILSPARKLMGQVKGPGGRVLGIVKTIEEKLEKGEAIAKA
ncbi:MAG: 50S ribosomal protein L10 [Phycisphaerales bacterium JB037]